MLLTIEKGISAQVCHAIQRYSTKNNRNIQKRQRFIISYVFRRKQAIKMSNVSIITC